MKGARLDPHLDLLDEARLASAAEDRLQRRLLTAAEEQDATFRGTLEELAETGVDLVVHTTVGRRIRGAVRALSTDHVTLAGDHGRAWVRLDAVTVLRISDGAEVRPGGGDRTARPSVRLADALRDLVEDRSTVEVLFDGGTGIRGTAVAAGHDLLTLRDGNGDRAIAHLDRAVVVLAHA